jgi:hypothetical protein
LNAEDLLVLLVHFKPSVRMLTHGNQRRADRPVARTSAFRIFKFVINLLTLVASFHSRTLGVPHSPFFTVTANTRKEPRVIGCGRIKSSSVFRGGARSLTCPVAAFRRATPFPTVCLGKLTPMNHLSTNRTDRHTVLSNGKIILYQLAPTPDIQVDDARNIIVFKQGIDGERVVGGIQNRLSNVPVRIPVKQFLVSAYPRHGVMLTGTK